MAEMNNNLTGKQKLALAGLIVLSIFIICLSFFNFNKQIREPFISRYEANGDQQNQTDQQVAQTDEEKQKSQDTDGDGLSDWDEINVYHTSPYLEDSDSDGITDGTEVRSGTDPNCPQGKDCQTVALNNNQTAATSSILGIDQTTASSSSAHNNADMLRKLLIEQGMSKDDLDKISDETLLQWYKELSQESTSTQ
jgi:hypothetical protein